MCEACGSRGIHAKCANLEVSPPLSTGSVLSVSEPEPPGAAIFKADPGSIFGR